MADEKAVPATEEEKKHGDELSGALQGGKETGKHSSNNAIPPAEDGGHARSVAAHLHETAHLHDNKNAVQHHAVVNRVNEPPQEVTRAGKDHRRQ